jgi:hypothetical protein
MAPERTIRMPISCSTPLALRHRADAAARDIKKAHAKNQNGFDFFQTEARQSAESLIFNQTFFIKQVPAVGANTRPTQAAANLIKNQVWEKSSFRGNARIFSSGKSRYQVRAMRWLCHPALAHPRGRPDTRPYSTPIYRLDLLRDLIAYVGPVLFLT